MNIKGIIIKAISGFYYVKSAEILYECRAPGIFRKKKITPYVGDSVSADVGQDGNLLTEVFPRRNSFTRPPLANLDQLFLVVSTCKPDPNFLVIDQLVGVAEYKDIEPIIVITKADLADCQDIKDIYTRAGFKTIISNNDGFQKDEMSSLFEGKISAFCGNSGVGKSTLLNSLAPELNLETAETSEKLGRGRHTTRQVELFEIDGGLVADTPGFSSMEVMKYDNIRPEDMAGCFREFDELENKCKFTGCSHTVEKGCAILEALQNGEIEPSRHKSYVQMYQDAKGINEWQ